MAASILKARKRGSDYYLQVHLDTTKLDEAGNPDPAWVKEWSWALDLPPGQTETQFLIQIRNQVRGLIQAEIAGRSPAPGTALGSLEGQTP